MLQWRHFFSHPSRNIDGITNTISPTIKYAFTYSKQAISFLDVQVYLSESRNLRAKLYKKTLPLWQYFTSTSNPLLSCKEGMIYSQALRYNMIISEGSIPQEELNNITHILLDCAYPLHLIIQNIKRPSFILAVSLDETHLDAVRVLI